MVAAVAVVVAAAAVVVVVVLAVVVGMVTFDFQISFLACVKMLV